MTLDEKVKIHFPDGSTFEDFKEFLGAFKEQNPGTKYHYIYKTSFDSDYKEPEQLKEASGSMMRIQDNLAGMLTFNVVLEQDYDLPEATYVNGLRVMTTPGYKWEELNEGERKLITDLHEFNQQYWSE